ncbi:hypothetical protein ACSSS7_002048 [Eimeria intestinalis]
MNAFNSCHVSPVRVRPATAAATAAAAAATPAAAATAVAAIGGVIQPYLSLYFRPAYLRPSSCGCPPHTALQQLQQQQQQQRLWARCCFDLTLPEDTRRRRSRKGSSRNPLKRLLNIPRGGWKQQQTDTSNSSSSSNTSSSNTSSSSSNADSNSNSRADTRRFLSFKTGPPAGSQTQQQPSEAPTPTAAAATAAAAAAAAAAMERPPIVDIGANLCDPMFEGKYFDKQKHPPDVQEYINPECFRVQGPRFVFSVLRRAETAGVPQLMLTTGSLDEFHTNLKLAQTHDPGCERLFLTIGVHPTRCNEFAASSSSSSSSSGSSSSGSSSNGSSSNGSSSNGSSSSSSRAEAYDAFSEKLEEGGLQLNNYPESYRQHLFELQQQLQQQQQQKQQRIAAVGEIGLDYDRLRFCDAATQRKCFELQLGLSYTSGLPLFLHMRNAADDFLGFLMLLGAACGQLMQDSRFSLINRQALTKAQIDGVKAEKWRADCQVKGRNEPCNIWAVGEVVRQLAAPGISEEDFYSQIYRNTLALFKLPTYTKKP